MKRTRVAKRYAKALFDAAREHQQLEAVEADLGILDAAYRESADFRSVLDSPVLPAAGKEKALTALFQKRVQPLTFTFLRLLLAKRRETILADVAANFRDLLDAHRGVRRGDLYSVVPMSTAQKTKLADSFGTMTGKTVVLSEHSDDRLLGGVVVRLGDVVYDASLRNQLARLRRRIVES